MGAFAKTIKERGDDIKFLWQHDWNEPIGKIIEIHEDAKGLFIKVKISETTHGKEALVLAKDGVINRMSIGYSVIKQMRTPKKEIQTFTSLQLASYLEGCKTLAEEESSHGNYVALKTAAYTGMRISEVLAL